MKKDEYIKFIEHEATVCFLLETGEQKTILTKVLDITDAFVVVDSGFNKIILPWSRVLKIKFKGDDQ